MQVVPVSPEWYTASCKNLALIEQNADDYEDPEEGDRAPSREVFDAVRTFLIALSNEGDIKLEEPRMFVSPNGHIVLTYGNKSKSIDIRFAPEVFSSSSIASWHRSKATACLTLCS